MRRCWRELSDGHLEHLGEAGQLQAMSYRPLIRWTPATLHCDSESRRSRDRIRRRDDPSVNGFAAQLGFRIPNIVISPFAKKHYVSHIPMDHTAVIKFVENRFIDNDTTGKVHSLTPRDAAQPNLLDFFDFTGRSVGHAADAARSGDQRPPWAITPAQPQIAEVTHLFS